MSTHTRSATPLPGSWASASGAAQASEERSVGWNYFNINHGKHRGTHRKTKMLCALLGHNQI